MSSATAIGFSANWWLRCHGRMTPPSCFPVSVSYSSSFNSNSSSSKFNYIHGASSEGLPNELVEDSKFVPLNEEDPIYGPPALLLLGFEADEALKYNVHPDLEQIQQLLKELDGEFLKIAKSLPRICFLSGLSGEEMMMFIDSFPETELKPAAFAALVPNSANKPLEELIEEIMGDHEMLTGEQL
ncbi:hypothetical protein JHK82_056781 [Glycine max]|nr:hypothetical protein JHK86_056611 [Glycine max]KAG4919344.1 hypothetical protein JHK85_057625 [Glycine max]KAG5078086.1 hypothetical protein JHK82_056781 [Glycine max]